MRNRLITRLRIPLLALLCGLAGWSLGGSGGRWTGVPAGIESDVGSDQIVPASYSALNRILPAVNLDAISFDQAVPILEKTSGIHLVVEWGTFCPPIDPKTPVTFHARHVRLDAALADVLRQLSAGKLTAVDFAPIGNDIVIARADELALRTTVTRTYYVGDLVPPRVWSADPPPSNWTESSPEQDALCEALAANVAPDRSHDRGDIAFFSNRIVVTRPWREQHAIEELLSQFRDPNLAGPAEPVPPAAAPAALAAMDRILPEVNFNTVPFLEVVSILEKASGTNIIIDWEALTQTIDRNCPITFHARHIRLEEAWTAILQQSAQAAVKADFAPAGNDILVTTAERLGPKSAVLRAYELHDLIPPLVVDPAGRIRDGGGPEELMDFLHTAASEQGGYWNSASDRFLCDQSWRGHHSLENVLGRLRHLVPIPAAAEPPDSYAGIYTILPQIDVDEVSLAEAFRAIERRSGVRIAVEWDILGPSVNSSLISLHARNVSVEGAVAAILNQIVCFDESRQPSIRFEPVGDQIVISRGDQMRWRSLALRTYDVQDLIGPRVWPRYLNESPPDELVQLLRSAFAPTWSPQYGADGQVDLLSGRLMAVLTRRDHHAVEVLLRRLREAASDDPLRASK